MKTIKVLNLNVRLNGHNEPIYYSVRHVEPIASCDNYFDMLKQSCEANGISYTMLLELIIELSSLELFEEVEEPIDNGYADYAYDAYKDAYWELYNAIPNN